MTESDDIKKIRQKVYRDSQQDGIVEIILGMIFLYYAVFIDNFLRGLDTGSAMVVFFVIICAWPVIYLKIIRNVFTYPRIGYVEIKHRFTKTYVFTVIIPLIILPVSTYIAVRFFRDMLDIDLISRLLSVAFGLVFGALFYDFAQRNGKRIYFILTAFSMSAGIILSVVDLNVPGVSVLLIINSIFVLFYGVFMLIRFIRKFPGSSGKAVSDIEVKKDMNNAG
ncbi:MAG: hypothetical protein GY863_12115 [bacterium]|nr:hypothetical protein [bacterium]